MDGDLSLGSDPSETEHEADEVALVPSSPHYAADCLDCKNPHPDHCSSCHHVVE